MIHDPDGSGYFLYHSIGQFPEKSKRIGEALADFADTWSAVNDAQWPLALARRQEFIEYWRRLIKAPPGTITTAENVTVALYSVIRSLPRHCRERRLLVTADCFPSLHFLLSGLSECTGFTLETVPLRPGEYWVREEDVIQRWTKDVGVALLTFVTSTASYRCDLQRLVEHGRRCGTVVGVDITQGIGLLPYDLTETPADFTVSTTLKWLCGTSGAGIIQMRESLIRECRPELRGWFSQEDIFSWDIANFRYAPDARRFDHGTPAVLGCVGSLPALKWHAAQDPAAILAHNRRLSHAIIEGAKELGLELACAEADENRGGSVTLRLPAETNTEKLLAELRARNVFADCRGRILRLSPGNMTAMLGVENLIGVLRRVLAR